VQSSLPELKTVARFLLIAASLVAVWYVADAPVNSQSIEGRVLNSYSSFARYGYADVKTTVQLKDGTTFSYSSGRILPIGSAVSCLRAERRFTHFAHYKC
jgi:hypothetical protein